VGQHPKPTRSNMAQRFARPPRRLTTGRYAKSEHQQVQPTGPRKCFNSFVSAAPVSLVVVMAAAEVGWGFRIELPHLCARRLQASQFVAWRDAVREQVDSSKRTCSDPASSRTKTGAATVRGPQSGSRGYISDRQMMAVGRPVIFPATSCSGGRDGINSRRGSRGCSPRSSRACASWEEGWTAGGPSTGQRTHRA
jgi:hypothetical protein